MLTTKNKPRNIYIILIIKMNTQGVTVSNSRKEDALTFQDLEFKIDHFIDTFTLGSQIINNSNTQKSVSSDIQTLWSWLKKTWLCLIFSTHFSVFGYLMKHSSLCLIYYVKTYTLSYLFSLDSHFTMSENSNTFFFPKREANYLFMIPTLSDNL